MGAKKPLKKIKNPMIKNHDDLKRELSDQMRFNQLLEEESQCEPVSEADALKYYEDRPELFRTEEMLAASHLLKMAKTDEEFEKALEDVKVLAEALQKGRTLPKWSERNRMIKETTEIWVPLEREEWFPNSKKRPMPWKQEN